MKKIFSIILAVMLLLGVTASIYAEATYTGGVDARVKTYTLGKTAIVTLSTTVTSANRILGFAYTDSAAGTGAIWDGDVATDVFTNSSYADYLIAEISVAAGTSSTIMFPFPRALSQGLVVNMTTATGCIVVYYQ